MRCSRQLLWLVLLHGQYHYGQYYYGKSTAWPPCTGGAAGRKGAGGLVKPASECHVLAHFSVADPPPGVVIAFVFVQRVTQGSARRPRAARGGLHLHNPIVIIFDFSLDQPV